GRIDGPGSCPGGAAVGGGGEHDVLVVEAVAAVGPGVDDLVGGVGAGRGAVGDVHAWGGAEVGAGPADAVLDTAADGWLEGVAQVGRWEDRPGPGPVAAAVGGGGQELEAVAGGAGGGLVGEHGGHAGAGGSGRCTRT